MSNKGFNISLQATKKMGGVLITTQKGNRALLLPVDGETVREHEGQAYINVTAWTSEEADQYGNHVGVQSKISKERSESGEKPPYIGNGKQFYPKEEISAPKAQETASEDISEGEDKLPF